MTNRIKVLLLTFCISFSVKSQVDTVKMYLMAGQSNMQGSNSYNNRLNDILCAKNLTTVANHPFNCYDSLPTIEDRIFATVNNWYWTGTEHGFGYDASQARLVAQEINTNNLVSADLLNPFAEAQVYYANYPTHSNTLGVPTIKTGSLETGFGMNNGHYGPELLFGHTMVNSLNEDIIIVKVAEGGTDLHEAWRSPSMAARLGLGSKESLYPKLIEHANKVINNPGAYFPKYAGKTVVVEAAGFVWFQG